MQNRLQRLEEQLEELIVVVREGGNNTTNDSLIKVIQEHDDRIHKQFEFKNFQEQVFKDLLNLNERLSELNSQVEFPKHFSRKKIERLGISRTTDGSSSRKRW